VVHRDLKPANIMIDGRGKVRIMDFGIAGFEQDIHEDRKLAGTPAYMAPELFRGETPSVRTDIYALGLVLYEVYTGKKAYDAKELSRIRNLHETATPTTPSSLVADMDPIVERVILRCLQKNPLDRPASVYEVLSALPGADPLEAMVAAGQTPSPDLVAQAGEVGGLRPRTAMAWLGATLLSGFAMAWLFQPRFAALDLSPERLLIRAEQTLSDLGYQDLPPYRAAGFATRPELLRVLQEDSPSPSPEAIAASGALHHWVRWSPQPMVPTSIHLAYPRLHNPPHLPPGAITAELRMDGTLLGLEVVPDEVVSTNRPSAGRPDWSSLLAASGADPSALTPLELPAELPGVGETFMAWEGSVPGMTNGLALYRATAKGGRPVHFSIASMEERTEQPGEATPTAIAVSRLAPLLGWYEVFMIVVPLAAGAVFACRNLVLGRGDKRGATVVACLTGAIYMIESVFSTNFAEQELASTLIDLFNERALSHALLHAMTTWLLYVALEPYARRMWPRILVSWARATSGKVRDPLVGRDLLLGGLLGFALALGVEIGFRIGAVLGWMPREVVPEPLELRALASQAGLIGGIAHSLAVPCVDTLHTLMVALLIQVLLRRLWLAVSAAFLLLAFGWSVVVFPLFGAFGACVVGAAIGFATVFPLFRFGLLPGLMTGFVLWVLSYLPATFDLSTWYAPRTLLGLGIVFALIGFGFFNSLAGRPLIRDWLAEPPPAPGGTP
jgi:serine/threonine-protein kinase